MLCLLFAMERECEAFLQKVESLRTARFGFTKVIEARHKGRSFLVAISGIGKGFAAAAVSAVASHYSVDAFINLGVAGSQNKEIADVFSCVIGSSYVEHDLDTSAIGDPVGLISGINVVSLPADTHLVSLLEESAAAIGIPVAKGVISSGDTFLSDLDAKARITAMFHSLCLDMETAPYAQIAYAYSIPYASARVISDAEHPEIEYPKNVARASALVSELALKAVELFR